ncbi:MAG: hypothetical protein FJX67_06670 [Alphaproteobacteria bacterium]|nr:hypothetical protein [Alphaproteobacteria bacterium]
MTRRIAQEQRSTPLENFQRPESRSPPPSSTMAGPAGRNEVAIVAVGSSPHTSRCAASGNMPIIQPCAARMLMTQAAETQPRASVAAISVWVP